MADDFDIRQLSLCTATAVRKASRRLTQLYDDALAPTGLRCTQYTILDTLDHQPDAAPTVTQLAETLVIDQTTLSHNLKPLERDGLIELRPDETDRRRRLLHLTLAGRLRCEEARPYWAAAQASVAARYGNEEIRTLRQQLLDIAHDERTAPGR